MLTQIKVYKALVESRTLGTKYYKKYDITNQIENPVPDTEQRDGVLDTSRILLLNTSKTPLNPLTRIIIEFTDEYNGVSTTEKIYRVVDDDNVENVVRGSVPLYRHTVSLVEPTKILERRSSDNLTFTNYLVDDTVTDMVVQYVISKNKGDIDDIGMSYTNSNRFFGPYHTLGVNDTISTNIALNIDGLREVKNVIIPLIWVERYTERYRLDMTEFYVKLPDGTTQNLSTSGNFTYTMTGRHTFYQKYHKLHQYASGSGGMLVLLQDEWECTISWQINVVASAVISTATYTMVQAIQRLLRCHKALLKDADLQEFSLDSAVIEKLGDTPAPEFVLTAGTLFEGLLQLGTYFHAIPRLIPRVVGDNDYSYWDIVTFDFLSETTEYNDGDYSLIDLENPSEEFANDFVSNIQNATITNYSGKSSAIEPIRDGFLSVRSESGNFEVSDNECIIKTREKIKAIVKLVALFNGGTIDISKRVIEISHYKIKSEYSTGLTSDMKSSFLYYTEGEKNIYGLNAVRKTATDIGALNTQEAIRNILGYNGYIKDIAFNIEYIPWVDFKARQYRTFIDPKSEDSTLFFNQQANEIDIEAYGENMHHTLTKTGNIKVSKTQYFNTLRDIPKCGQYCMKDGEKYIAFQVNRELAYGVPIKATIMWAKNYNELFANVAIKSAVRQFEISERECVERNVDIQNFCVIDNVLDLENAETPYSQLSQSDKNAIRSKLWFGFGHPSNLNALAAHLNSNSGTTERLTTAVIVRVKFNGTSGRTTKNILCPATFHSFGRSIVCRFSADDNYSMGTYIDTTGTGREDVDTGGGSIIEKPKGSYAIENYIQYCDKYGRADYLEFALVNKYNKSNWNKQGGAYYLYKIDDNDYFRLNNSAFSAYAHFGYGDNDIWAIMLNKDSREKISVTCQLNFISQNKNVKIYKPFVDSLPYICDSSTHYKEVIFVKEQRNDEEEIDGSFYIAKSSLNFAYDDYTATLTLPSIFAGHAGCGYGIITNDNKPCIFIRHNLKYGDTIPPIHLMFRHNI